MIRSRPAARGRGSELLCPSARPEMRGSHVFGVVEGTVEAPRTSYLTEAIPATEELLASAHPVEATEVFRIAAPCAEMQCVHFSGSACRLAERVVTRLPAVVDRLPTCAIRPHCRWFREQGKAACMVCPSVVTKDYRDVPLISEVATETTVTAGA